MRIHNFGSADDVRAAIGGAPALSIRVLSVPGADHSMAVLKSSPLDAVAVARRVVECVHSFIDEVVANGPAG